MTQFHVPITDGLSASQLTATDANCKLVSVGALSGLIKQASGSFSSITDNSANWNSAKPLVPSTSFYVRTTGNDTTGNGSSGSPWATITKALSFLDGYYFAVGTVITIYVGDGTHTYTESITISHSQGSQIYITGENTYTKTVLSLQSCGGSSGAFSPIVNLNNVSNVAVGDYILIPYNIDASPSVRGNALAGCYKITNVDTVNKRVTLLSKYRYSAAAQD